MIGINVVFNHVKYVGVCVIDAKVQDSGAFCCYLDNYRLLMVE